MTRPDRALFAQAFADQCRRWTIRAGKENANLAWQAGWRLVLAEQAGDISIDISASDAIRLVDIGLADAAPASNLQWQCSRPLVVASSKDKLYLARYFLAEAAVARAITERLTPNIGAADDDLPPAARSLLPTLFPDAPSPQQVAVIRALTRHILLLAGGPGTGKTHVIARLLACAFAAWPDCRVALTAPTGKAAARIQESLVRQIDTFPAGLADTVRQRLRAQSASTLHRLLGLSTHDRPPRYHALNPLPCDLVIVDEASMMGLALAQQLVDALLPTCRLVLMGDPEQLPPVEAGDVFSRWVTQASAHDTLPDLPASLIRLEKNYRAQHAPHLNALIAAIRSGNADNARAMLVPQSARDGQDEVAWIEHLGTDISAAEAAALTAGFLPYREAVSIWQAGDDPRPLFQALDGFRVLTALRDDARGMRRLNAQIAAHFTAPDKTHGKNTVGETAALRHPPARFFVGQPLMVAQNDPQTGLFNGDTGIILPAPDAPHDLQACFPDPARPDGWRWLPLMRMSACETAFVLTTHKAQGSEFWRVAFVLPNQETRLLTRKLIYTAITRARHGVLLLGDAACLLNALNVYPAST
jgi:exodeoxyribonuclease V alpha subunit